MQQQNGCGTSSLQLWQILHRRLDLATDSVQFKGWMCSVGGVDDSSCRSYQYYGQIYYRVTLLMYFYELIYISFDEDVLGFDMDNVWASASNLLEEMFSTWGQHLIRLDCAGLAVLIVSAVQKCILHLCSITISAIMTPIRLMLFPVCLVPFILYYLRPLCLVALLLTIGFKSLRWRKKTTSALKLVAQGKKQTQEYIGKVIAEVASIVAILAVQVGASTLLQCLVAPVWAIEAVLACFMICQPRQSLEYLAAIVLCNSSRISIVKCAFLLMLINFCVARPPEILTNAHANKHNPVFSLAILHFLLLLLAGTYVMFLSFLVSMMLVRLIQILNSKCAHLKCLKPQGHSKKRSDIKQLWDIRLPIKPYH